MKSMNRMFAKSVDSLFGNIIFAMRSPRYTDMTPQSEVVRDDPVGRTPPLSAHELCKQAGELWHEVRRSRGEKEWDDADYHMVAVYGLMGGMLALLDRTNLTPEEMEWAYGHIRVALDRLGFTREREQKDEERVADNKFLMEHGICFPEWKVGFVETEEM